MKLAEKDRELIETFRRGFEKRYESDERFRRILRDDRADGSSLASRFEVADHLWLELVVRPFIPQLRAGIVTDDRWKNEDLEDKIEESGDTMSEFVELGFEEAGLEWLDPPVEHYREAGKFFCFSTAIELPGLSALRDEKTLDRISRMLEGYWHAFRPAIEKAAAESQ